MNGQEKFDKCLYRSSEKHYVQEVWCCGAKREEGYLCIRKLIDNVTPTICNDCIFYQPKTNVENKEGK